MCSNQLAACDLAVKCSFAGGQQTVVRWQPVTCFCYIVVLYLVHLVAGSCKDAFSSSHHAAMGMLVLDVVQG
jgi:hypothetical protein